MKRWEEEGAGSIEKRAHDALNNDFIFKNNFVM